MRTSMASRSPIPKPEPAPAPAPAAAPTATQPTPAEPAAVAPAPQPVPAPAPVATPVVASAPAADAEQIVSTPEGFLQSFEQGRDNMIRIFADQTFALSDEDRETLESNPAEIVPQLMGRALFAAISSAQRLMMTQLPHMIAAHTDTSSRQGKAQEAFYGAFPDLQDPKFTPAIQRYADFYKQQFPDLPLEERIAAIGNWARQHFKLQPPQATAVAAPPKTQPQAPHVVQQSVFQPAAAAGGAVRGGPVASDDDPFAGAFVDYD